MDPFTLAALGLGGAQLGAQVIGNIGANKKNRELAQAQAGWNLDQQREAQQYDYAMWNRTNLYNSPKAQMARFKQAGLNPHLIYGRGNAGQASPLTTKQAQGYQRANHVNPFQNADAAGIINQTLTTQAQTNNLEAMADVNRQEALNKATMSYGLELDNNKKEFDLGVSKFLRDTNISAARNNVEIQRQQIEKNAIDNRILSSTEQQQIEMAEAKLKNIKASTGNLNAQKSRTKVLEAIDGLTRDLNQQGIYKTDPYAIRLLIANGVTPENAKNIVQESSASQKKKYNPNGKTNRKSDTRQLRKFKGQSLRD